MPSARDAALEIAARLRAAGHLAYFAGGCVRDRLRGEEPKDYDVATDAAPARVHALFPWAIGVGEAFGVMLVRRGGHSVEVATFRSDGEYSDRRRPDVVSFGSPREDALRRDFTINGLFEDPESGEVIDYVGGQADLRAGVVRAIGDPMARLDEDRLRTLRAVRFAARFRFAIEPATLQALEAARSLSGVSRERVGQELRRMLADRSRVEAARTLEALSLDAEVLGEPTQRSTLLRLAALPADASVEAALVAWLLDRVASGDVGSSDAAGPEAASDGRSGAAGGQRVRRGGIPRSACQRRVDGWSRSLVLSNDEIDRVSAILSHAEALGSISPAGAPRADAWFAGSVAMRKRRASAAGFADALAMLAALDADAAVAIRNDVQLLAATPGGLSPTPFVTGDDLVQSLGLSPGPLFKALLHDAYDAQLEGVVGTPGQALEFVRQRCSDSRE